jgi:hypothetical protein
VTSRCLAGGLGGYVGRSRAHKPPEVTVCPPQLKLFAPFVDCLYGARQYKCSGGLGALVNTSAPWLHLVDRHLRGYFMYYCTIVFVAHILDLEIGYGQ